MAVPVKVALPFTDCVPSGTLMPPTVALTVTVIGPEVVTVARTVTELPEEDTLALRFFTWPATGAGAGACVGAGWGAAGCGAGWAGTAGAAGVAEGAGGAGVGVTAGSEVCSAGDSCDGSSSSSASSSSWLGLGVGVGDCVGCGGLGSGTLVVLEDGSGGGSFDANTALIANSAAAAVSAIAITMIRIVRRLSASLSSASRGRAVLLALGVGWLVLELAGSLAFRDRIVDCARSRR